MHRRVPPTCFPPTHICTCALLCACRSTVEHLLGDGEVVVASLDVLKISGLAKFPPTEGKGVIAFTRLPNDEHRLLFFIQAEERKLHVKENAMRSSMAMGTKVQGDADRGKHVLMHSKTMSNMYKVRAPSGYLDASPHISPRLPISPVRAPSGYFDASPHISRVSPHLS